MSRSVYSIVLVEAEGEDIFTGYAVPAGFTVVVRDIAAFQPGSPEDTAVAITNQATGTFAYYHLFTDAYEFVQAEMRQVFPEGSTVTVSGSGPNAISVRVCGYLLTNS